MTDLDGNTSGQTTGQTTGTTSQTTGDTDGTDHAARAADFQVQLAQQQGDLTRLAEHLHDRVFRLRDRARAAEAQIPKEGTVVIKAEEAELLKSYKSFGTPQEIEERGGRLTKLEKYQMVSEAAAVAEMNPKVLSRLLPDDATLEIGEATGDDGTAKRVVTLVKGDDSTPLDAYATAQWSDFLPALKAEQDQQQVGTPWIQQGASAAGEASNGMNPILKAKLAEVQNRAKPQNTN